MTKLIDKLWNWGHLEGSHNRITRQNCSMTPEQYAEEYGIKNAFIVSYGGNIQPPFNDMAKRLSSLNQIKWSVLGDASTPEPDAELGNTEDILDVLGDAENITGGVVDDFFVRPIRAERFPPEVLKKIKKALNDKGLDFWCVMYNHQLDLDLEKYMDCFDGITFWIWECDNIVHMDEYLEKLFAITKDKPVMLGVYVWDYSTAEGKLMDTKLFEQQLGRYFDMLKTKEIEGVIICSSTLGDADLETNKVLKKYIAEQGDIEID
ncbi:MAG: hypothetical protein IKT39_03840 [Clostridia bacterium]|nr:hypothetical protein [Clostridia bacterium]